MKKLLPLLLLFLGAGAHAAIPAADAQWSVNEQGRTGDTCFYEHINGTLEDCTNTTGVDTSNAIDGIDFDDAASDYVEVGSLPTGISSSFLDGDYTLAVRVEPDDSTITGFQHIFGVFASGTDDARYQIYKSEFTSSGAFVAAHNDNGGQTDDFSESTDNGTDEAVVVYRRSGNEFSLWIDGVEVSTQTTVVGTHGLTWNRVGFGARTDGNLATSPRYFDGTIEWAAIWESALTDAQIQELDDSAMPFPDTDVTAPSYTVAPACGTVTADTASCTATATDDNGPIDHYMAVYSNGAAAPTCANVQAGTGTGVVASSNDSDLNVTSGVGASMSSGAVLTASTAYDVYFCVEDDWGNESAVTKVDITTSASGPTLTPDDTTPNYNQTVVFTLSGALAGGNPTELEFANGDTIACDSATSTTCTITFAGSDFDGAGDLNNTEPTVAQTVNLTDASANDSGTASLTFNNPDLLSSNDYDVAGCANPGCDDDSLYEEAQFLSAFGSFASGDSVWLQWTSGACVIEPTTGVIESTSLPCSGTVRVWDNTGSVWFNSASIAVLDPDGDGQCEMVKDMVVDIVIDLSENLMCGVEQ